MKKFFLAFLSVMAAASLFIFWYTFPKPVHLQFEAVKYQLGSGHQALSKPTTVNIDGKLKKSLLGIYIFKGTIDIEGENLPVPADQRQQEFYLGDSLQGGIMYAYFESHLDTVIPKTYSFGGIYFNRELNKVSIFVNNQEQGWSANNGFMIAGPASSRAEALAVSNELMSKFMGGFELK